MLIPSHARSILVAGVCLALVPVCAARGPKGAYEGFAYGPNQPINGLNGGTGWTVPWTAGVAAATGMTTLNYPLALPPAGVDARTNDPAHFVREFLPGVGDIDTANRPWMCFLLERDDALPASLTMVGIAVSDFHLMIDPDGTVHLQYGGDPPATAVKKASGPFITDMFIIHLDAPGQIQLWIDPAGPLGVPDAAVPAPPSVNYGNVDFFLSIAQTLDEIRTGPDLGSISLLGCYPDFTGDGTLDLFDFLSYVNSFNAADPGADCDGNGRLDLFDFLCFVNAFNAGC